MRMRRYGVGLGLVLVAGLLTGCSPQVCGGITLSRNEVGQLMAVMEKCRGEIEYVSLSEHSGRERVKHGEWTVDELDDGSHELNLETGTPTWKASNPWQPLKPGVMYTIGAWDEGQSWSLGALTFTVEALTKLKPGLVLGSKSQNGQNVLVPEPLEKFKKVSCGG
ncbi:hypothetical protein [Kribbella deserti]|uniref:Lipoprotein n=1 Tax=Kribbella deserti TaxID=1926257 RepID=A0ABV6QCY7_9ACTN